MAPARTVVGSVQGSRGRLPPCARPRAGGSAGV